MSNQSDDTTRFVAYLNSDDLKAFRDELAGAPPRSAAILGLALIEDQLRALLDKATIERSGVKSFTDDRIWTIDDLNTLAYRFGLIDEQVFKAIRTLASIRNTFAHQWNAALDWDHPRIKSLIGNLDYQKDFIAEESAGHPDIATELRWRGTIGAVIGGLHSAQTLAGTPDEVNLP